VWRRFYHGVFMVTGKPGSGKGLFTIVLMTKMKRLFGRRVMLDFKPREGFGPYIPFNENILYGELDKMTELATIGKKASSTDPIGRIDRMKKEDKITLAQHWMSSHGEVFMQGAAMGLDELKRYLHNRRGNNPMGILIGHIVTIYRHLDLLFVGMAPQEREIDAISFLPYVTHRVRCSQGMDGKTYCDVYQSVWVNSSRVLEVRGKPFRIRIDGGKPREDLGGLRYFDLYNSKDPKVLSTPARQMLET